MPLSANILRWAFCLLMLLAGGGKLLDMPGFYPIVDSYRLLPGVLVIPSAWALALSEVALAAWLVWGRHLKWTGLALIAMHAFYLCGLTITLLRGIELPNCGCFGVYWGRPLTWFSPLEDLALLALSLWFWRGASRSAA